MRINGKEAINMGEEKQKTCPLMTYRGARHCYCLQEACAVWIKVSQGLGDRFSKLHYEGCGLVTTIPWELVPTRPEKEEGPA